MNVPEAEKDHTWDQYCGGYMERHRQGLELEKAFENLLHFIASRRSRCDCYLFPNQVCDDCQSLVALDAAQKIQSRYQQEVYGKPMRRSNWNGPQVFLVVAQLSVFVCLLGGVAFSVWWFCK